MPRSHEYMHEAHVADGPLPQQREGGQVGLAREPCRGSGTDRGHQGGALLTYAMDSADPKRVPCERP